MRGEQHRGTPADSLRISHRGTREGETEAPSGGLVKLCRLRVGKAQLWASTPFYRLEGPQSPFAGAYLCSTTVLGDPGSGATCSSAKPPRGMHKRHRISRGRGDEAQECQREVRVSGLRLGGQGQSCRNGPGAGSTSPRGWWRPRPDLTHSCLSLAPPVSPRLAPSNLKHYP